jgi:hypothetical protein
MEVEMGTKMETDMEMDGMIVIEENDVEWEATIICYNIPRMNRLEMNHPVSSCIGSTTRKPRIRF